eukprot:4168773-Amphidinium_carterae.1
MGIRRWADVSHCNLQFAMREAKGLPRWCWVVVQVFVVVQCGGSCKEQAQHTLSKTGRHMVLYATSNEHNRAFKWQLPAPTTEGDGSFGGSAKNASSGHGAC